MYKVYFENRFLTLSREPDMLQKYGLFHKFIDTSELYNLIIEFQKNTSIQNANIYCGDIKHLWKIFRIYFTQVQAAGGLVKHSSGRFLFIRKREKLDLPKGHMELNEDAEHCALREVSEECGLTEHYIIKPLAPSYHTYYSEGISYLKQTNWFLMGYEGKMIAKPQTDEGITSVEWLFPKELNNQKTSIWFSLTDMINSSVLKEND